MLGQGRTEGGPAPKGPDTLYFPTAFIWCESRFLVGPDGRGARIEIEALDLAR